MILIVILVQSFRLKLDKYEFIDVKDEFLSKLDNNAIDAIDRKLRLWLNKSRVITKLERQSFSSKTEAAILIQGQIRKKIASRTVENRRNMIAQSKAKEMEIQAEKERQLLRKKKHEATTAEKMEAERMRAVHEIQRIARGRQARRNTEKKNDDQINSRARLALCKEPGLVDIMGEVLRETVYNLIQEATLGEFVIESEPLKFVVKREEYY